MPSTEDISYDCLIISDALLTSISRPLTVSAPVLIQLAKVAVLPLDVYPEYTINNFFLVVLIY
jgi:hypothetical protein